MTVTLSSTASEAVATPARPLPEPALAQLFTQARTPKTFSDEPVTDDQLRQIYELVKMAPTSLNIQPLRVVYVGPAERDRLVTHVSSGNREKTATAPVVAILAADTEFHERIPELMPHAPHLKDSFDDPAGREQSARFNAALQIGYFTLAVRAVGLMAGPMGGFDRRGVDEEFLADTSWRSLVLMNIGHPGEDAWRERLPRLDYDDAVRHV